MSGTTVEKDTTGPENDLSAVNQPAGTTKVENGIAYDISGKALGPANEGATAPPAGVIPQAVAKPKFDPNAPVQPIAAAKPKFDPNVPVQPVQNIQESTAALKTYLQKTGQWAGGKAAGEAGPGGWQRFKNWVNAGLISPETITTAMTGYTPEEIQERLVEGGVGPENRKLVHIPHALAIPLAMPGEEVPKEGIDIDLYSFFGGMMGTSKGGNISQVSSGQTSPMMVGALGAGHVVRALGAARNFVQATQVAKVLESDVDAAAVANTARVEELVNATKQVERVQANLKTAVEARDAGQGTQEAVIDARNIVSEATANLGKARQAVTEASEAKALAGAKHAIAVRNAAEAEKATQTILGKAAGKLPMLPEGAVTAANIGQKGVGATFTLQAGKGVLEPRGENETIPDYIGRVAENGAYFMLGAGETARDIKGTYHAAQNGAQAFGDWYRTREAAKSRVAQDEAQIQAKKDFMKAIPSGPGKANYSDDDYAMARPFLEDQHANVSEIKNPKHAYSALEAARQGIEDLVRPQVDKYADNDLSLGKNHDDTPVTVMQRLVAALMPSEAVNTGFLNKGLKAVEGYNLTNPTVGEADIIRRKLNSAMRGRLQQNRWSISDAITSDPSFAAMYELDAIMRDGVYQTLKENGVSGAEEARRAEASLIKVRNAAERQFKNAEQVKRGTGEAGPIRKILGAAVKKGVQGAGAAAGAKIAGPEGAAIGAIGVGGVAEAAQRAVAPGDLTVEKLLQRSMKVSGAPDTRPVVTDENALLPAENLTPHPRENTPLHADLAGFYGEAIGDTPYAELEKRFMSDVAIKKNHGVPLEGDERKLLVKINTEKIAEIKEAQKAAEKEAEAQQKIVDEQAKLQKQAAQTEQKVKEPAKEAEAAVKEGGAEKAPVEGEARAPMAIKPVGSWTAEATEPIQETPVEMLPTGHTDKSFHGHEWGHVASAAVEGIHGTNIISHQHPEMIGSEAIGGVGWQEKPYLHDPEAASKFTPEQLKDNTTKWLRVYLGGAAANAVLDGIPFDMEHEALRGDVRQARGVLDAFGVKDKASQDALIQEHFEQAKKNLTTPGVRETIEANRGVREKNLPPELHASTGRVEKFQSQIKGLVDENKNGLVNAGNGREGQTVGENQPGVPPEGKSATSGRRKESAGGPEGERVDEGKGAGGRGSGLPVGSNAGREGAGGRAPGVVGEELPGTPKGEGSELAKRGVNHEDVLEKIKGAHGVTNDTAGIQNGQSFITPEGQFVHLPPGTTHTDAIQESGGAAPGPENGHDNRPAFINDTGAIRVHLANERAGRTLAASVSADGVKSPEQVTALQQLVGKELPRTGNLRLERADVNAENVKETSTEKAFPRVSDVPKMLKKIGALPPDVERSMMTADAMKGLKEARESEGPRPEEWEEKAARLSAGGGFTIDPRNGNVPDAGHVVDVYPEIDRNLGHPITPTDVRQFYADHHELFDEHPELHIGGYGNELNASAIGPGAEEVGRKLRQNSIYDLAKGEEIKTGGDGIRKHFPGYSLDQRLKELGARTPEGKPTGAGTPPERSMLSKTDISKISNLDRDEEGRMEKGIIGPDGVVHTAAKEHDDIALSAYGKDATDILREGGVRFANYGPTSYVEIASKSPETVSRAVETIRSLPRNNVELDYWNPKGDLRDAFYYHGTPTQVEGKFRRWLAGEEGAPERSAMTGRRAGVGGVSGEKPEDSSFASYARYTENKPAPKADMGNGGKAWLTTDGNYNPQDRAHENLYENLRVGSVRIGNLEGEGKLLVHTARPLTEQQRASLAPDIRKQGGAIFDFEGANTPDRNVRGEVDTVGDFLREHNRAYTERSEMTASDEWKKRIAETPWETDNQPWKQFPTGYRELNVKNAEGGEVGTLKYSGQPGDLYSRIRTSRLEPNYRNQGLAKEMYKSAIEDARKQGIQEFRSDTTVSNDARNVWGSLAREGYPVYQAYTNNFNANGAGGVEYTIPLQGQRITDADFKPLVGGERSAMATRLPNVRELSVGDPAEDKIIKDGGGIPGGLLGDRVTGVRMFHDPLTHTTLGFGPNETATPETVQAKLLASRKEYAKLPINQVKYGLNADGTVVTANPERSEMAKKRTEPQAIGSTVKLLENPLPIKGTGATGEITTADVGQALAAYTNQKLPALELDKDDPLAMVDRAKSIMRDEAKYQMTQNNAGAEWYTKDIGEHDKILGEIRPELKDPTKLSLFKFAEAVLSAGHNPVDNFNAALQAWDHFHETGEFPLKNPNTGDVWGRYGYKSYANALGMVNRLVEEHGRGPAGQKGAVNWLLSNHPVSELKEYNPNVSGPADLERPGAVILGPKRGPFALNLHGREAEFTADQWVDRSWNRWMGTAKLDSNDPGTLHDRVYQKERNLMRQSFEGVAADLGVTTSSLQAIMWYYEQALYDAHGVPTKPKSFSEAARAARDEEASTFKFGANAPLDVGEAAEKGALDKLAKK